MSTEQKKLRILRPATDQTSAQPDPEPSEQRSEGATVHQLTPREEIEKIKSENLTGRQLRIARRLAQKNGLQPTSDLDAVRLLRSEGIDPFERAAAPKAQQQRQRDRAGVAAEIQQSKSSLPATVRSPAQNQIGQIAPQKKPAPQAVDDATREKEVRNIQKGLVKRRRRRLATLMVKLAFYVLLPTLIASYYFYRVATPMYATYTEFVIQQAEAPGMSAGGGLLAGSPFATATDSISVQGYLTSRDAMLRLDENPGFRALFQTQEVDVLQRLEKEATNEEAYRIYKKRVIIGFDPAEGVVKMEVIAPSPEASLRISEALVGYAEERVDQLSARLRADQVSGAEASYAEAEVKFEAALDRVAELQRQSGVFDSTSTVGRIEGQIAELEGQILTKELELEQLKDNLRPNRTKVRVLEREIELLNIKLQEKEALVTQGSETQGSVIDINAELEKARTMQAVRQEQLAIANQNLETARVEANRQTRYLEMGVAPVVPDKAAYPRAFENTLLAFLIFAGIYLMVSLTVSILREQVST